MLSLGSPLSVKSNSLSGPIALAVSLWVTCHFIVAHLLFTFIFFFSSRRRHTRSTRDWSSDVCSSDLLAIRTDSPHQTLGANQVHRSSHQKWLDAHVHQTADGRRGVIGVQSGKHQVAGQEIGRASCRERGEMWVVGGGVKKQEKGNEMS